MAHRTKRTTGPRCIECRKPIRPGEQTHDVRSFAGLLMSQMHREVTNRWHLDCWAAVEKWAAESRAESERQRALMDAADKRRAKGGHLQERIADHLDDLAIRLHEAQPDGLTPRG